MTAILTGVVIWYQWSWYLIVVLIYISLISEVEHLFHVLLAIWMSSLERKSILSSSTHCSIKLLLIEL